MEASTMREAEERDELTGRQAVEAAAGDRGAERMSAEDQATALAWFMEDDPADNDPVVHTFQIDVGTPDQERWLDWTIQTLDIDTIDAIRQQARGNRAQRRQQLSEVNEMKAAVGIVLAATITPNLEEAREAKGAPNVETVLKHRFRHKPGLILQISGKVMEASGYDEENVREATAAKN